MYIILAIFVAVHSADHHAASVLLLLWRRIHDSAHRWPKKA